MMDRCYNKSCHAYDRYGGAGILVCDEWHDVSSFIRDMGEKPKGFSIERLDNAAGYSPQNCVWANSIAQGRNRSCVKLSLEKAEEIRALPRRSKNGRGPGMSRAEIADMYGVSVAAVKKVLSGAHWSGEKVAENLRK